MYKLVTAAVARKIPPELGGRLECSGDWVSCDGEDDVFDASGCELALIGQRWEAYVDGAWLRVRPEPGTALPVRWLLS